MPGPTETSPLIPRAESRPRSDAGTKPSPPAGSTAEPGPSNPKKEHKDEKKQGQQQKGEAAEPATPPPIRKADTNISWPAPAGLHPRGPNDENLAIFRRALGISQHHTSAASPSTVEQGRQGAAGVYAAVLRARRAKRLQSALLAAFLYACHITQVVVGAVLTALGPGAARHAVAITALGAVNTVVAGLLALIKGQGLPERLRKDAVEFRRLQDWVEETEALLAVGVVGRDRKEVGVLVEVAFKKYNAAKASEENNRPDSYVRQAPEGEARDARPGSAGADSAGTAGSGGNAVVRLDMR